MTTVYAHFLVFITLLYLATEKLKLQEKGANSRFKFIYKMTQCDFCFSFWISVFTVLFFNLVLGSTWDRIDLGLPFMIMGIWILTQKIFKWLE